MMFKRKPAQLRLSDDKERRAHEAFAAIAAVDPKAYDNLKGRLNRANGLWELLAPSEEIMWLQASTLVTDADGEVNRFVFAGGIVALTSDNFIFNDYENSRNGHWPLSLLTTVNFFRNGLWRGGNLLQISVSGANIGFALSDFPAGQELVKRLNISIAKARRSSSRGNGTSAADELSKWAKLHQEGAISEQEFFTQKSRLLGR